MCRSGAGNVRRCFEIDVHALWTVLEIPSALRVMQVVAIDEIDQGRIGDSVTGQFQRLRAFVPHTPSPTRIERQPAVAMRHIWPFGHRLSDDFIHSYFPTLSCIQKMQQSLWKPVGLP